MSEAVFAELCRQMKQEGQGTGIGRLQEKTLHAVLKRYLEPDTSCHEIPVGRYVADIRNAGGIVEIQTGQFHRLKEKLAAFLELGPVTVIYPVAAVKWLIWVDEDGSLSKPRKSPKRGLPAEVFREIYALRPYLSHPNFRLHVLLLELEEYRLKNGWGNGGKKGSVRYDRIPLMLLERVCVNQPADCALLLPEALPELFTAKELRKLGGISPLALSAALAVLTDAGVIERVGKRGKAYLYQKK